MPPSLRFLAACLIKKKAHVELTRNMSSNSCSVVSTIGFLRTLPTVLMAISNLDTPRAAAASEKSLSGVISAAAQTVNGT